jgi:hypothetical protein
MAETLNPRRMSHGTDPSRLRGDRSNPEGPAPQRLVERLVTHLSEWPRRYIEMRVDALDPER